MSYQMNNQYEMNHNDILNIPINLLNDFNHEIINIIEDDESDTDTIEYNDINNSPIIESNIYYPIINLI